MLSEAKGRPCPFTFTKNMKSLDSQKLLRSCFYLATIQLEHCPIIPAEIVLTECATKFESRLMF